LEIEKFYNTKEIKRFYFPGKIISGVNALDEVSGVCSTINDDIVVIIDAAVIERQGVQKLLSSLSNATIATKILNGAPITQDIENFVASLSSEPRVIVSIGGGSVTDFAKGIICKLMYGTIENVGITGGPDLLTDKKPLLVCVPTTAGSGAEASRYYVTYDLNDHHKVYGKSFKLIADWVFIDPDFLGTIPRDILASCAFDAFVHFFESLICQYERSKIGEMLSLHGITEIMSCLDQAILKNHRNDDVHGRLMESATLAGVAISNVRTGNIHEAAGALLELTNLSHPETLFVFFRDAIEQYENEITDRETLLVSRLNSLQEFSEIKSLNDIISWWEKIFVITGLDEKIRKEMASCPHEIEKVKKHVFERIYTDKVWVDKECPRKLSDSLVTELINLSFDRFGFI